MLIRKGVRTNKKNNKNSDTGNSMVAPEGRGMGVIKGKGGQLTGDGRRLWAHNAINRRCVLALHT